MSRVAIATFDAEGPFIRARTRVLGAERRVLGEWTPYAAASVGGRVPGIVTAVVLAGIAGVGALFALTVWSAHAYRFNAGGRPLFSWAPFLLSPIEVGALAAAIGGAVLFFRRAGLTRLHHAAFEWEEVAEASQGRFVLAIACDAGEDANRAVALLTGAGAVHSRVIGP